MFGRTFSSYPGKKCVVPLFLYAFFFWVDHVECLKEMRIFPPKQLRCPHGFPKYSLSNIVRLIKIGTTSWAESVARIKDEKCHKTAAARNTTEETKHRHRCVIILKRNFKATCCGSEGWIHVLWVKMIMKFRVA
jgi:hypothetical protein